MQSKRAKLTKIFDRFFKIENDIDITDDCAVLYRRNVVIKNIIFLSNIFYSLILFLLSFSDSSNFVLSFIIFPLTFVINNTLRKMINTDSHDFLKQNIAMYFACFYMFLSAIIIYFKLKSGNDKIYSEVGYILIYYSLVIVSLYQDGNMLKQISKYVVAIVTVIHFTITYNIVGASYADSSINFIKYFFVSDEFKDILLRTIILVLFIMVLISIVNIGQVMQEERKKELIKRKQVQDDFTKVIKELFNVTLNKQTINEEEIKQASILGEMVYKLSSFMGYAPNKCEELNEYAKIHITNNLDFNIDIDTYKDDQFETLKQQAILGSIITKRLELNTKCDNIIRAHEEGWNTDTFIDKAKNINNDEEAQIVLICDIYVSLRSPKNYKRPWSHSRSIELLETQYKVYFDNFVFERFMRFKSDFEKIYNEF